MERDFQQNISKEEVMNLPIGRYEGEIVCIDSRKKLREVLPSLWKERVLGFDTETRPSFKKGHINPLALIQLATSGKAWLIRLNKTGYDRELWRFLYDDKLKKIGIGLQDDLRKLQEIHPFQPGGFLELQEFVKDFGIEDNSLVKITAQVLGFRVSKSQQLSNWEADRLTEKQQKYAATDAWVCYQIYRKLNHNIP